MSSSRPALKLSGHGVHLRQLEAKDAPLMAAKVRDPRVHAQTGSLHGSYTEEEAISFIASRAEKHAAGTNFVYAVEHLGALAGVVGLDRQDGGKGPFELGYWIAPEVWGKGLATSAGRVLLDWLDQTGERVCLAAVNLDNPASLRVLRKLGFMLAGRDRRTSRSRGGKLPVHLLARIV